MLNSVLLDLLKTQNWSIHFLLNVVIMKEMGTQDGGAKSSPKPVDTYKIMDQNGETLLSTLLRIRDWMSQVVTSFGIKFVKLFMSSEV